MDLARPKLGRAPGRQAPGAGQGDLPGLWEPWQVGEHAGSGQGGGFVFSLSCMSLSDFACLWGWESWECRPRSYRENCSPLGFIIPMVCAGDVRW